MSKISKTAKASMVQTVVKAKAAWTPETAIPEIRRNREAKLFVGNMELLDVLLAEYDSLLAQRLELSASKLEYVEVEKFLTSAGVDENFGAPDTPDIPLPSWVLVLRNKIDAFKTLNTMAAQNRATITVLREGRQAAEEEVARLTETVKQLTLERDEARAQLEQERDVRLLLSGENAKLAQQTGDVVSNIHEAEATMLDAGHK